MKIFFLIGIIIGSQFIINQALALCIGCGCQKGYSKCIEDIDKPPSGEIDLMLRNRARCRDFRSVCHGNGIRIGFLVGSSEPFTNLELEAILEMFESKTLAGAGEEGQAVLNALAGARSKRV